ncbi:MAG: hypothetical protein LLG02_13410 [Pelosinus sp.]|nr:hypothetical protein [Pelosinus sp.]
MITLKKIILLLLSLLLCCSMATAQQKGEQAILPDPFFAAKGQYAVGTTSFVWQDTNTDGTKYIGQIWYPAISTAKANRAPYLPECVYKTADLKNDPTVASLQSVTTGCLWDAPILAQSNPYPVLIYSPGLGLSGQAGTFFFEYLASRGYIIAAINHPGSSFYTEKADGSLVLYQDNSYDTPFGKAALTKRVAGQLSCTLDALIRLNATPESAFFGKIDTANVGVFGHSIGGRSALRAAALDKRFKAAANLDGSLENEDPYTFSQQSILLAQTDVGEQIQAEITAGSTKPAEIPKIKKEYQEWIANLFNAGHAKEYLIYYKNTQHMNYTDLPLLLEHTPNVGTANSTVILLSLSKLLDGFFSEAFFHPKASLKDKLPQCPYAELKRSKL